ncbi:fungal-specific transcription factor domain-containing protein [Exophiala viscosa]|uniref:Xylanolytic transcriptional activator xlnR n=1 Tax=Exophiala viscosa TaxID=2486360 RepID=A0AAN6IG57_9EURO|nr:fungal-specific transcription factor domain-containing protein [Exophiala viscosa]
MLSRIPPQTHNSYSDYHDYGQRSDMITSQPHQLSSILQQNPQSYENDNLQAGRKRRESELDANAFAEAAAVRRRISRACDQCNQLRTKCDGKQPCAHCTENSLVCEYARAHKKRGRAPKKEAGDQNEEAIFADSQPPPNNSSAMHQTAGTRKYSSTSYTGREGLVETNGLPSTNTPTSATFDTGHHQNNFFNGFDPAGTMGLTNGGQMHDIDPSMVPQMNTRAIDFAMPTQAFNTSALDSMHVSGAVQGFGFPLGDDYSVAFMGKAPMVESPDWLALTSPMFVHEPLPAQPRITDTLRYPVLRPLLPHIEPILPQALACDLLEQYFTSSTSAYLRPANPYVLGYIFRKKSILHPTDPRPSTPALLASMLWTAAQTSDAPYLTSQLDARARICQRLLELTINMLKPLVHSHPNTAVATPNPNYPQMAVNDTGLGALVVPTQAGGNGVDHAQVDNLATYIHLATVVSASERKAASLRWWNAAWSLAREIRLGRELPPNPTAEDGEDSTTDANPGEGRKSSVDDSRGKPSGYVSEEEREERRRTWWLLYMQDRHLALCYNRPMFFLNKECEGLLQPLDDEAFQAGRFDRASDSAHRRRGLNIECTSHSVFGYFLPLMVILGEILDLNHARNRPRFGPRAKMAKNWDEHTDEITQQLEAYGQSLKEFEASGGHPVDGSHNDAVTPSVVSAGTNESHSAAELALQTKTVVAYGMHIMHVLHILLTGKWDPIALLDDNDLWISSQSFVTATGHAVSAAEAVSEVIEVDPDLSFMPFFFGVYLLQGSFLLLLFADKLQGDVSPDVVKACETIVRAHEACVATLDTQYQRNFRKVMRSALQQVRGRIPEDLAEQQHWRREVLALYRWTGDGTGLAL